MLMTSSGRVEFLQGGEGAFARVGAVVTKSIDRWANSLQFRWRSVTGVGVTESTGR